MKDKTKHESALRDWTGTKAVVVNEMYTWFSRYVIAAKLVEENKRPLISSFCSSTNNCTLHHCYLSL